MARAKARAFAPNICGMFAVIDESQSGREGGAHAKVTLKFRGDVAPYTMGSFALESKRALRVMAMGDSGVVMPQGFYFMEHDGAISLDDSCKLDTLHASMITRYGKSIRMGNNDIRVGTWLTELLPLRRNESDPTDVPPVFQMKFPDTVFNALGRAVHVAVPFVISEGSQAVFHGSGQLTSEVPPRNYDPSRYSRSVRYPSDKEMKEDAAYLQELLRSTWGYLNVTRDAHILHPIKILLENASEFKSDNNLFDCCFEMHKADNDKKKYVRRLVSIMYQVRQKMTYTNNHSNYNECCSLGMVDCLITLVHTLSNVYRQLHMKQNEDVSDLGSTKRLLKKDRSHRFLVQTANRLWRAASTQLFIYALQFEDMSENIVPVSGDMNLPIYSRYTAADAKIVAPFKEKQIFFNNNNSLAQFWGNEYEKPQA